MEITVGVLDYQFALKKPCPKHHSHRARVKLSFELTGNFLTAAQNDKLLDTVDYDVLCVAIEDALDCTMCMDQTRLHKAVKSTIKEFSPLITGGYFTVQIFCHETFIIEDALL